MINIASATTIKIQDNVTGILEDDNIGDGGDSNQLYIDDWDGGSVGDSFIKINISGVPDSENVTVAQLYIWVVTSNIDVDDVVGVWGVQNYSWNEDDGASITMRTVQGTSILNRTGTLSNGLRNFTVTDWVISEHNAGKNNITFGFYMYNDTDGFDDYAIYWSKEYNTNISRRPFLNITHTDTSPTSSCNPPTESDTNWTITSEQNCSDQEIVIDNGLVRVLNNGTLRLDNVTLLIDRLNDTGLTATGSQYWINGTMIITNSTIGDYRQYSYLHFKVESNGVVELTDSTLTSDLSLYVHGNLTAVDTEILGRYNEIWNNSIVNFTRIITDQAYARWWWFAGSKTTIKDSVIGGFRLDLYGELTSINSTFYPATAEFVIKNGGVLNCTKPYSEFRNINGEVNSTVIGYLTLVLEEDPSSVGERWIPVITKRPNGSVVSSRNVSTYNSTGSLLWNGSTDANGFVWAICTYNSDNICKVQEEGGNYFTTTRTSDITDDQIIIIWEDTVLVNATASPNITGYGEAVTLKDNITGLIPDAAWVNVTYPDGSINSFVVTNTSTIYEYSFNDTWQMGEYTFQFIANGTNSSYLGVPSTFNITGQTQMGVRVMQTTYNVSDYVNLTDPPAPSFPLGLNWNYVEEILVAKEEVNKTMIVIELESDPMIVYSKIAEEDADNSFIYKSLGWLFGKGLKDSLKSQYLSIHEEEIDKGQLEIIEEMNERYDANLYKDRKMKYLFNGLFLEVEEELVDSIIIDLEMNPLVKTAMRSVNKELHLDGSIPAMDIDHVWALQNDSGSNITGKGIKVAILDTGIEYNHSAFGGCDLGSIHNGTCDKIIFAYDYVDDDDDPFDTHGHGTHTAGIVASSNDTYRGVAPDVDLMIYRVCGSNGCPEADIIAAIENASLEGADIISMSFGASTYIDQETLGTALLNAWNNGTILVASAGNSGRYGYDSMGCPACLEFVIAVAATNDVGTVAIYSSRGYARYSNGSYPSYLKPDVAAVGSSVMSSYLGDSYASMSGTSMSCPHVAGIIALMKQYNPSWTKEELKLAVTENAVRKGNDPLKYGGGFISAYRAVNITSIVNPSNKFLGKNTNNSVESWNTSEIFTVTNMRNYSVNYTVSVTYTSDPFLNITLNVSEIDLPGGNSTSIKLSLNITNVNASNQRYFGYIALNSTPADISPDYQAQNYTIPFSFVQTVNDPLCPEEYLVINESMTLPYNLYCYYDDWSQEGVFRIASNDVFFDCNSTVIEGDTTSGIGIYSKGYTNVTMKNCRIKGYWYGTYFYATHDSTFVDNEFNESQYALNVFNSDNANITRNVFNNIGWRAINLIHGDNFDIYNNSIYDAGLSAFDIESGATGGRVYDNYVENSASEIWYIYNNNFTNNTFVNGRIALIWSRDNLFSGNNFTSTSNYSESPLIEDAWDCSNTLETSNTINGKPYYNYCKISDQVISGLDAGAVVLHTVNNVTIKDSTIGHSIYVKGTTDGVTINNVSVTGFPDVYGYEGLVVYCGGGNVKNVLFANSTVSRTGEGMYVAEHNQYQCYNITASKVSFNDTRVRGVRLYGSLETVLFQDVSITNGGYSGNYFKASTLINTTFDNGDQNGDNYTRKWWVTVQALDNLSQQVMSSNITITDNNSNVLSNTWTGYNGSISKVAITEYTGYTGSKVIKYPHSIYVSKYGYNMNTTNINITSNQDLTLIMIPAEEQSKINNTGSYDLWGYLYIAVDKYSAGIWSTWDVVVNDTTPRNISIGNYLAIDVVYNGAGGWTADTNGTLRILAEFRDSDGDPLLNDDGSSMVVTTVFEVGGSVPPTDTVKVLFGDGGLIFRESGKVILLNN